MQAAIEGSLSNCSRVSICRACLIFIAEEIESIETMLMLFRAADLTVTMRYHAGLLADIFCMPNLIICSDSHRHYFNKMHALAASYPEISRLLDVSVYTQAALFMNLNLLSNMVNEGLRNWRPQ